MELFTVNNADKHSPSAECPLSSAEHRPGHLVKEHCVNREKTEVKLKPGLHRPILEQFRNDN